VVATGVGLIAWRGDRLRAPGRIDSPVSREGAFLGNNLLFAGFAFVVLLGTVFPLLAEALNGTQLSVGEPYFDRMAVPIGIALLFLMAVAPALPWRAASGEVLRRRLAVPTWAGAVTMPVLAVAGVRGVAQLAAFGLAAFALAGIGRQVVVGLRSKRRMTGRLYGGLVVHVGVVVVAVALAASQGYSTKRELRLDRGESASVAGYSVTYLGRDVDMTGQRRRVSAQVRVAKDGEDLGVFEPSLSIFPNATQAIGTPAVRTGLLEDVYLTLVSSPTDADRVTIGVALNPMVLWLWIGGGIMAAGTVVALLPGRRRRAVSQAGDVRPPERELVPA
jgi:cytochrome c-type biogenesis protein CcmF